MRDLEMTPRLNDRPDFLRPVVWSALGFAAGYLYWRWQRDEDRPPIIVRGGSLYFTSGTQSRPGRQWLHRKGALEPIHPQGKVVEFLVVDIYTSESANPVTHKAKRLTIRQGIVDFNVRVRPDKGGRRAPAVAGPLRQTGGGPNWTLKYEPTESESIEKVTLDTIEGTEVAYERPLEVWIWQC
jgi:hypothetical protein